MSPGLGRIVKTPVRLVKMLAAVNLFIAKLDVLSMAYILAYIRRSTREDGKDFSERQQPGCKDSEEFQMEGDEVEISKRGGSLVLRPKRTSWATLFESLEKFTDDFMEGGRTQPNFTGDYPGPVIH